MEKEIVLIGRSNVGKSTLFRLLSGAHVRVGRKPGVTRSPVRVKVGRISYVDMPGYGFMKYLSKKEQERTKDQIVSYIEEHAQDILLAVQVIDAASFLEIASRWAARGEVPFEIELYEFLNELGLDVVVAANKMDRIANPEEVLDGIAERLGMLPPWRQWQEKLVPISAKKGDIEPLQMIIRGRLSSL
jgi:GTP-binding protein EngB required for normal cell division